MSAAVFAIVDRPAFDLFGNSIVHNFLGHASEAWRSRCLEVFAPRLTAYEDKRRLHDICFVNYVEAILRYCQVEEDIADALYSKKGYNIFYIEVKRKVSEGQA